MCAIDEVVQELRKQLTDTLEIGYPGDVLICNIWEIPEIHTNRRSDADTIVHVVDVPDFRDLEPADFVEVKQSDIQKHGLPFVYGWNMCSPDGLLTNDMFRDFIGVFGDNPRYFSPVEYDFRVNERGEVYAYESSNGIIAREDANTEVEDGIFLVGDGLVGCVWFCRGLRDLYGFGRRTRRRRSPIGSRS